jgi:hypothetical protein
MAPIYPKPTGRLCIVIMMSCLHLNYIVVTYKLNKHFVCACSTWLSSNINNSNEKQQDKTLSKQDTATRTSCPLFNLLNHVQVSTIGSFFEFFFVDNRDMTT